MLARESKVYEMTNAELRGIKDEIIKSAFPELMDSDIAIEFVDIKDSFMQVGELEDEGHFIEVDESLIKIRGDREEVNVLKGGIAHELAHIIKEPKGLLNKWIEKFLYRVSWKFKELDERNTDFTVVLRGYGKELLKFLEYCEKDHSRYREDGLSQIELEILSLLFRHQYNSKSEVHMHPSVIRAIDEIDATMFSGDAFLNEENNAEMQKMLDRWQRGLNEHKETIKEFKNVD